MYRRTLLFLCPLALLASCREGATPHTNGVDGSLAAVDLVPTPMVPEVSAALEAAGDNRAELERAITESQGDERKAAAWLVARTPYRGTVGEVEAVLTKQPDAETVSAALLRSHISKAFEAWKRWPWAREVDSDTFLRFVLPYRMTTEALEDWRSYFLSQADLVAAVERFSEEYAAAQDKPAVFRRLVHFLNTEWLASRMKYAPRGMPDLPPSKAIEAKTGRCTDLTNALIALCRTFGIAATGVRTIWWPRGDSNHYWATMYDPAAKTWYDVDGGAGGPCEDAYFHIQHGGLHAKVYKVVPGEERGAVARSVEPGDGESIPPLLDWYLRCLPMVDVTSDYAHVTDVTLGGLDPGRLYGLAVFNNAGLQEVSASRADPTGTVNFPAVGCDDVLYFVTWFEWREGSLKQHLARAPFVARPSGRIEQMASPQAPFLGGVEVVLGPFPRNEELVVRAIIPSINSDGWQELGVKMTDESGALTLPRALLNTVFVVFHKDGRPAGRPYVAIPGPPDDWGVPSISATVVAERF